MKITPTDATLGAVVTDVRLADLDDHTWKEIEDAFHEHAVLIFPGQHLSDEEQQAFGRRFGEFDELSTTGLTPITNQLKDGSLLDPKHVIMGILKGNEGWHTDSSYMPVSAKASMLSARIVPRFGGSTEWADMRAAYDALSDSMKELVGSLSADHSIAYSQRKAGFEPIRGAYGHDVDPPPRRPLVKVHPVTGRPALYIGRHAHHLRGADGEGMTDEESEAFLDGLVELACQAPRVYAHAWQVGDVVVWDNRCVLHRARPWDLSEPRSMVHTRIKGEATEIAV
jgi:alpha-ketoglutarate-dependent taurine dioxygenase